MKQRSRMNSNAAFNVNVHSSHNLCNITTKAKHNEKVVTILLLNVAGIHIFRVQHAVTSPIGELTSLYSRLS
jgi:hypothetical protein